MQHLTLEDLERLARKQTGCTDGGCVFGHPVVRLLVERDSLERERDEAREQVRSLTETVATKDAQWRSLAKHFEQARRDVGVLREEVRSLTVERDGARAETSRVCQMLAEEEADSEAMRARLSRAREAFARLDTAWGCADAAPRLADLAKILGAEPPASG